MQLIYETTYEDFLEFARISSKTSPVIAKIRRRIAALIAVVVLLPRLGSLLAGDYRMFFYGLLIAAALVGVIYFGGRVLEPYTARFFYSAKTVKASLGRRTLQVTDGGIREQHADGESVTYWKSIDRVVDAEQMALIYFSPIQAFIIPKNHVIEGNVETFLAEVQRRREQAAT